MFSNFNFMNGAHHHGGQMPQTMPQGRQDMRAHAAAMEEQRRREQEQERRQRGPPPASRVALKNIPDVTIAAHDLAEETNRSCSVCLDDHELGEKVVKLPCAHIFHRECVWEWLELHCTCPVCRFELETEDRNYEKERRVRMQGRRPRYRRRELESLSIPQIRNLARGQNVNIAGCLEKADIVGCIVDSGTVEIIEAETPQYEEAELSRMSLRQLRSLMLQTGIDVEGCLEKTDLLERVINSRLITVTRDDSPSQHPSPPPPPPPPPVGTPHSTTGGRPATSGNDANGRNNRPGNATQRETTSSSSSSSGGRRSWGWFRGSGGRAGRAGDAAHEERRPPSASASQPTRASPSQAPAASHAPAGPIPTSLESMSVKELRVVMTRLGVSAVGCLEKRDMVERIRERQVRGS